MCDRNSHTGNLVIHLRLIKTGSCKSPHIKFIEAICILETEVILAMLVTRDWFNHENCIVFNPKIESIVKCTT